MGIVESDKLCKRDFLVLLDIVLTKALNGSGSACNSCLVLLDLACNNLANDCRVLLEVGKTDCFHLGND